MRFPAKSPTRQDRPALSAPCRKPALPTPSRKPAQRISREAMESSFSRVFPIPPSRWEAPPRRRSNSVESWLKKRPCNDTKGFMFRQLPETFFDAPPPHVFSIIRKVIHANVDSWEKMRRFKTPNSERSGINTFRSGGFWLRQEDRMIGCAPAQPESVDSKSLYPTAITPAFVV